MSIMDPSGPIKTTMHPVLEPDLQPSTITEEQQHALDHAKLRRRGHLEPGFAVDPSTLHGRRAVENAVMLTYTANRAYAQVLGDDSFKPFAEAEAWQLDSNRAGILKLLDSPTITPEASHLNWMLDKLADGWKVGHVKDATAKTHPCMVHFSQLPVHQRAKDHLFLGIARQALKTYGVRTAWWKPRTIEKVDLHFGCTDPNFDHGMLVAYGRACRLVAGALGGLYRGFGRTMLQDMGTITTELAFQVSCSMMSATPQLAYEAYRANMFPAELPELTHNHGGSTDATSLRRAHWWVMNHVARAVMEIEGVELEPPRRKLSGDTWTWVNKKGATEEVTVEVHGVSVHGPVATSVEP